MPAMAKREFLYPASIDYSKDFAANWLVEINDVTGPLDHIMQIVVVYGLMNSTSVCEESAKL
jgi:hypothetical protein